MNSEKRLLRFGRSLLSIDRLLAEKSANRVDLGQTSEVVIRFTALMKSGAPAVAGGRATSFASSHRLTAHADAVEPCGAVLGTTAGISGRSGEPKVVRARAAVATVSGRAIGGRGAFGKAVGAVTRVVVLRVFAAGEAETVPIYLTGADTAQDGACEAGHAQADCARDGVAVAV